ncbi:MAG: class I SAM-dependent methyltransferase [Pseudomonadota bacterium]
MATKRWNKDATQYRSAAEHYDASYSADQTRDGDLRGEINAWKFLPYCDDRTAILDFGCGDGALLTALGGQFGVEINPHSAKMAEARGYRVEAELEAYADDSADLIVSNHCLEHVEDPLSAVREMKRVLTSNGLVVLVVPCHNASFRYREPDRDFHLFSWSAANLGNMVKVAGFEVLEARELKHRWPPKWRLIKRYFGTRAFHAAARLWGHLDRSTSQVICVARPTP